MDPVTHTLFGVAIGEAAFRPKWGRRAVTISAWAANLPDIDGIVMLYRDPSVVILRRSFGHSVFLLPLWVAGLAWIFHKKYDDIPFRDIALIVGVNAAGHLLFDLINSFGVQLFWPFSWARPELSLIFIIDLALTGLLAAPHLARLKPEWRPRLRAACAGAIATVAVYFAAVGVLRARAVAALTAVENGKSSFQYVFPEPFGPRRWRGVAKDDEARVWRVYLLDGLNAETKLKLQVPNDETSRPAAAARETRFGRRLMTFFKAPVWSVAARPDGGATTTVYDLRFSSLLLKRAAAFSYSFDEEPGGAVKARGVRIW